MTADPVNLNRFRKAKARTDAEAQTAANRAAHGRTGAQKRAAAAELARRDRALDGAKREG